MISFLNIPDNLKPKSGSLVVAEVSNKELYEKLHSQLNLFHKEVDGRFYVKLGKKTREVYLKNIIKGSNDFFEKYDAAIKKVLQDTGKVFVISREQLEQAAMQQIPITKLLAEV